jgi:hypothetical protein
MKKFLIKKGLGNFPKSFYINISQISIFLKRPLAYQGG